MYEALFIIGFLLYLPKALWRRRLPHRGWSMRLGRYPDRIVNALRGRQAIWVHAVSVGEVLAVQPLLRALSDEAAHSPLVLSTITPSGFEVASKQVGERGLPIYFPVDLRPCVTCALDTIHPRILLLVESELWPTVIRLTKARGLPIAVVNGRISPRTFRRYQLVRSWLKGMLDRVDLFLMQSQADADRVVRLGAPIGKVRVVGSLKWDASLNARPAPEDVRETAARIGLNAREAVIVAGSTHRGEEGPVLGAFRAVRAKHPETRLIVAPRHLERLAEVEGLIRHAGFSCARFSQTVGGRWDVGLVDAFGQLPRYYGLATIVFIGGSLIPHGGQNPLEATSLGKPVIFGPSMHNFAAIAHELLGHHAAMQVAGSRELAPLFDELIADPAAAQQLGRRAQELTERFQGATQRTLTALQSLLVER